MSDYQRHDLIPLSRLLEQVGERLAAYRISRRIKQEELAEKAGISVRTLSRVESGGNGTLDTLARLFRALDIDHRLLDLVPDATANPLDPKSEKGRPRQRVRKPAKDAVTETAWQWGDEIDET